MFDLFVSPGCGGNINDRLFRTHLLSFAMGRFGGGSLRQCDAGNLSGVSSGFVFFLLPAGCVPPYGFSMGHDCTESVETVFKTISTVCKSRHVISYVYRKWIRRDV